MAKKTPYKLGKLDGLEMAKKIAIKNGAPQKGVDELKTAYNKLLQS